MSVLWRVDHLLTIIMIPIYTDRDILPQNSKRFYCAFQYKKMTSTITNKRAQKPYDRIKSELQNIIDNKCGT